MTVMTTATRELDIGKICLLAYRRAGLLAIEQTALSVPQATHARDELETIVDHIQAEGNITRDMELYPVTLTSGTATYTMPSDTLRVDDVAMYKATSTDIELQCASIDRDTYERISNKALTGRPYQYYPARGGTVTLTLYFVPDTTGSILTVQRQRLLADVSDPNATVDLERSWTMYLVWALAHLLAVSASRDVQACGYLRSQAEKTYAACKTTSTQSQPFGFHLNHGVRSYR